MKKMSLPILAAITVALSSVTFSDKAVAQIAAPVIEAKAISQAEAMKKYPPPPGGYPVAERARMGEGQTAGIYKSPYSGRSYDCREIKKDELVLDPIAKKVFRLP